MKSNFVKYLALALVLSMLITVGACAKPAPTPPPPSVAEFEVISLDIEPPEVIAGETVSITAEIKNIGDSEGSYTAILSVDGATVETKEVTLAPGALETVSFSMAKDAPGTYEIGIGELSSSLTVKEPALVVKEVELKYDDGVAETCLSSGGGGYLVDFAPPSTPFTIKKVRICAGLFGSGWEGRDFEVEIWDKDYKILHSAAYPLTEFAVGGATWVTVETPDIEVSDKFYVHVYTGTARGAGLSLGTDNSVVNTHSEITIRTAEGVTKIRAEWGYMGSGELSWIADKSKVNFMIRVVGTGMMAES